MADKLMNERLGRLLEMLEDWPDDSRPDRICERAGEESTSVILSLGIAIKWIEEVDIMKPCASCGTSKAAYRFYRITPAGQAALDVSKALRAEAQRKRPYSKPELIHLGAASAEEWLDALLRSASRDHQGIQLSHEQVEDALFHISEARHA